MSKRDERRANLMRASAMTRVQAAQIDSALAGMSNEQLEAFIDNNPEVQDMLTISADTDNSGIVINYAGQPNNQHEEISVSPPWEADFSAPKPQGRVNLFQVGSNPTSGMSFMPNGFVNNMNGNDERIKQYTPGMQLYGINPYNFPNAIQMVDYFNMCEKQREWNCNQQYGWALFMARGANTREMYEWAESFKFIPADQIVNERQEAQAKAEEERQKALMEEGNNVIYDVYDVNGIRLQRACDFEIIKNSTGEVVRKVTHKKDKLGQSFTVHTQLEDRKREYELQQLYNDIICYNKLAKAASDLFTKQYEDNKARWAKWEAEGLTRAEQWARWEDERIDWGKHEKAIYRALKTASFSREHFRDILASCCNMELNYANRSNFFSLSYDFERDLHYKSLISTPEEMNADPMVHQKLQEEYDIKRKMFMNKVQSGNLGCEMAQDAHYHPTFAKTPIHELTLEDFKKPENQFMYTQTCTPEIATKNMFIPEDLSGSMTKEKLANMGVHFDANGQVIPQQRTMGIVSIDDDTGEVLSHQEFDVTPPSTLTQEEVPFDEDYSGNVSVQKRCETMSDEELENFF